VATERRVVRIYEAAYLDHARRAARHHTITANFPKWVFSSSLERKVAINFPDLHAMFRRDKLNINLVTIWSM
jgi:hypothetical protein